MYFYKGAVTLTELEEMPITKLIRLSNHAHKIAKELNKPMKN
jgi:hypothetical protein